MAGRLAGKTAFITAAGPGYGPRRRACLRQRRRQGLGQRPECQAVGELEGKEGIKTRVLDVTNEAAIQKLAAEVGEIDVLFNCAGIVHHGTILDAKPKDWDSASRST